MLKYQKHQTEAGTTRTDKPATIQRMENNFLATFWALCGRSPATPRPQVYLLCPRTTLSPPPTAGPTFLRCLLYLLWQWDPESKPKPLDGLQPKGGSITSFSPQAIVGVARWAVWAGWAGPKKRKKSNRIEGCCTIRLLFGYMSNFYGHTQSNPRDRGPLYLRPKWFVCPWGIGKYV